MCSSVTVVVRCAPGANYGCLLCLTRTGGNTVRNSRSRHRVILVGGTVSTTGRGGETRDRQQVQTTYSDNQTVGD